jgi:hypothetical protein
MIGTHATLDRAIASLRRAFVLSRPQEFADQAPAPRVEPTSTVRRGRSGGWRDCGAGGWALIGTEAC